MRNNSRFKCKLNWFIHRSVCFTSLILKHIVPLYRLGTCQINEMETAIRDWLRMQESAFCLKGMFTDVVVVGMAVLAGHAATAHVT